MTLRSQRSVVFEQTANSINKRYGVGAIMRLGEAKHLDVEALPTGSLSLDIALGIGGLPRGRVVEIYGPEASGKTTLCHHIIAEAQNRGGYCAFIDMEHALDPAYAVRCGVQMDHLYISQPDTGEQALDIAEALIQSAAMAVVVIDSIAALVPKAEIDGEMGDAHIGLQARLMSQALRKLSGAVKQSGTLLIFTNQLRSKTGVLFGNPETTSGGNALKYYASVRLDIRSVDTIRSEGKVVGSRTRVIVKKSKVARPFTEAAFDILHDEGISRTGDLLDLGVSTGLLEKRGNCYHYGSLFLGNSRDYAKAFLKENEPIQAELYYLIRKHSGLPAVEPAGVEFLLPEGQRVDQNR